MKCKNCGAEGDGNYCEHCGTPLTNGNNILPVQPDQKQEMPNMQTPPEQIPLVEEVQEDQSIPQTAVEPESADQTGIKADGSRSEQSAYVHMPNQQTKNSKMHAMKAGGKADKPIYKKWWFWGIAALVIIVAVAAINGGKTGSGNIVSSVSSAVGKMASFPSSAQSKVESAVSAPAKSKVYKDGTYMVGKDIEAGLYKATLTDTVMKMGYIERAKAVTMSADDILANIILTGNGYVEIKNTDKAVKLQGVSITKIDLASLKKDPKAQISDGMYLVGYDIKPGTYKVEVTDTTTNMGYVERTGNASMDTNDIIANEIIQGPGYVEIKDTDFAVRVQGAKLTLQQ